METGSSESAENKAKMIRRTRKKKMDVDDTKPAIVDEKAIAEIESKLAKVQKDLQNAMRSGNHEDYGTHEIETEANFRKIGGNDQGVYYRRCLIFSLFRLRH